MSASSESPINADGGVFLVDTSAAVALLLADHEAHGQTVRAVQDMRLGLSGHAAFETYSVLTRLPSGSRRSPADVRALLAHNFPETRHVDARDSATLIDELAAAGIAGGSVFDGLVALAAKVHQLPLISRDRRALPTYDRLGVEVRFLG